MNFFKRLLLVDSIFTDLVSINSTRYRRESITGDCSVEVEDVIEQHLPAINDSC